MHLTNKLKRVIKKAHDYVCPVACMLATVCSLLDTNMYNTYIYILYTYIYIHTSCYLNTKISVNKDGQSVSDTQQ